MANTIHLAADLAPALRVAGLDTVDSILAVAGPATLRSVVKEVELPIAGTVGRFHVKRYLYADWARSRGLVGRGTLWGTAPEVREFQALELLRTHGIGAARPVAAVARTRYGRLVAHALLTEHVPRATDLSLRLRTPGDPVGEDDRLRRRVLAHLARQLARLHAAGLSHGDAYARNVLVRIRDDVRIWFVDCRRGGKASRRHSALADVATLDGDLRGRVPATDRWRLLRAYLAEGADVRSTAQQVARLRERFARRDRRKGRIRR